MKSRLPNLNTTQKEEMQLLIINNNKHMNDLQALIYDDKSNLKEKLITDLNQGPQDTISPPKKMIDL